MLKLLVNSQMKKKKRSFFLNLSFSCLILPAASISSGEKSKNRKWGFEKRGLLKREIRLNMPFFAAYGMNVLFFQV